ncbi:MAG: sodium:solute symporter family protein [Planctomycetales bacterium]|nr:sodium:solute symporter family protein [Planctomycetales bacterium]
MQNTSAARDAAMTTFLFLLVCLAFLAVGIWAARRESVDSQGAGDLINARRRLPTWMACLTLAATWIGGGYINGTAEATYDSTRGLVWCQAPWCYALSLIVGGLVFAKPMRERGYRTMLDLFEQRHGTRIAAALFVPAVIGDLFWTSAILAALGGTLSELFQIDFRFAICLSMGIVVAYTVWGGLWSVACSDILQLACIVFGLAITVAPALHVAGGWTQMSSDYVAKFGDQARLLPQLNAWWGSDPWAWQWLDSALLLILGGVPWQVYFQRILACRTSRTAMSMSVIAGFICLIVAVPPAVLGAVGATLDWSALAATPPAEPAAILPHLLRYALPASLSLLGLLAILAAVMSSMDSSILSSASLFAWNVYRPIARVPDTDPSIQRILRGAIVAMGCLAILLALEVESVYQLWYLSADLVYVILFPQLVTSLFLHSVTPRGAVAGAVVAVLMRAILFAAATEQGARMLATVDWPVPLRYAPWLTLAMLCSLSTIVVVSRMRSRA